MTFPPCFSNSFSTRPSSGISTNNNSNIMSNMQLINKLQHDDMVFQQWRSMMFPQLALSPTRIFPDLLPVDSEDNSKPEQEEEQECHQDTNEEQDMEDNAARMLLELSQIVSKEISADSGCITRGSCVQDTTTVHKNEELQFHQISKDLHSHVSNSNFDLVSPCVAIPKSIEINYRDWGDSYNASSTTSRSTLEQHKDIPYEVDASKSSTYSTLCSPLQSSTPFHQNSNSSFEIFSPSSTTEPPRKTNRYRTVSLAGDEMNMHMNNPLDQREQLSPSLLLPLSSSPLPLKDLASSFPSIHESPFRNRNHSNIHTHTHLPRLQQRQHSLFWDRKELEREAIRRALVSGGPGANALSTGLAVCSAANVNAIVITPEQPRPVISFPKPRKTTSNTVINKMTIQNNAVNKDRKRHFPLELPPMLLFNNNSNNKKQKNPVRSEQLPKVSAIVVRSDNAKAKPSKRAASAAKSSSALTRKASKKRQSGHGPRATKKKPPRQRHTGKKFSWKAYPGT